MRFEAEPGAKPRIFLTKTYEPVTIKEAAKLVRLTGVNISEVKDGQSEVLIEENESDTTIFDVISALNEAAHRYPDNLIRTTAGMMINDLPTEVRPAPIIASPLVGSRA